ncbi:transcriptional regulator [Alcaligenaceae bacterium CGII-47]|nr:transcriptional regulator [Alcaligenaceae bacterium CGII-47]
MTTEQSNPFVLPGFGQSGETAQNPVLAGMEMMRKAWQGMAGAGVGGFESAGLSIMSIEDLERRISELQTVESWLRLNLSMLSNTIQGLEIQRSTMTTLRSFAAQGMPQGFGAAQAAPAVSAAAPAASAAPSTSDSAADTQPYAQAAGDWWNLVQEQFQNLAAATAASLQTASDEAIAATATPKSASATKSAAKSASKSASKSSAKSGSRATTKSAAGATKKAAPKRTTQRSS